MQFTVTAADAAQATGELLVIPVLEDSFADGKGVPATLRSADAALGGLLLSNAKREGFGGKRDQAWAFHTHGKLPANQVVLLGLGKHADLHLETLRLAAGRAAKIAGKARTGKIAFALHPPSLRMCWIIVIPSSRGRINF